MDPDEELGRSPHGRSPIALLTVIFTLAAGAAVGVSALGLLRTHVEQSPARVVAPVQDGNERYDPARAPRP